MKNNVFDKFIKEKLDGYKPPIPDSIWEGIAQKVDRKKPVFFWWHSNYKTASILLLLVATSLGVYFIFKPTATTENKNITQINKQIINNTEPTNQETALKKTININEENISKKEDDIAIENTTEVNLKTNGLNSIHFYKGQQTDAVKYSFSKVYKPNSVSKKERTKTKFGANIEPATATEDKADVENSETLLTYTKPQILFTSEAIFVSKLNMPNLPAPPYIPCPEVEKNAAANKKYVEFYAGPDYVFNSFEDTGTAYIEKRKASTAYKYAFTAGLRYTKVFGNGMSIKTGINYSQINEHFFAKTGSKLSHEYTVSNAGDTTSSYILSTPIYEKSMNVYRNIGIPIQLGYEFGNGIWHTNISAGVLIDIWSKQSGKVVNQKGFAEEISTNKSTSAYQFKSNTGLSFLGSASVYYKLNDHLHLLAEPYIRYGLSPITKSDITLKQKSHTVGLRLGIRWDL